MLPINEIFETIRGEACKVGAASVFVRLQACRSGVPGATPSTLGSPIQSGGYR